MGEHLSSNEGAHVCVSAVRVRPCLCCWFDGAQTYIQKKKQTGTDRRELDAVRAGQGVLLMEELLRKDRPRLDPANVLDSVLLLLPCVR